MIEVAGPPNLAKSVLQVGINADYADPVRLKQLLKTNLDALASASLADSNDYYARCLHFQIATSLFRGIGSRINEDLALQYLASAALGGLKRSISMFCLVESSCTQAQGLTFEVPRSLCLTLGHLEGSLEASDYLRASDLQLFHVAKEAEKLVEAEVRHLFTQDDVSGMESSPKIWESVMDSLEKMALTAGDSELFAAIATEDLETLQSVCGRSPAVQVSTHSGLTPLHALTLINDHVAAKMAPLLIALGADSESNASEPRGDWKNRTCLGLGYPLSWAIIKNRPLLVEVLVGTSFSKKGRADEEKMADIILLMARFQRHTMIRTLIQHQEIYEKIKQRTPDRGLLMHALSLSIEGSDHNTIGRRWSLGSQFQKDRESTVQLLLDLCADPLCSQTQPYHIPLRKTILRGDLISLRLFIKHLCPERKDALKLLGRTGVLQDGRQKPIYWSALFGSLEAPCPDVFRYLLSEYPELVEQRSVSGRTPLHSAACHGDLIAIKELLAHGAKVLTFTYQGATPFVDALCHNQCSIAKILAQHADAQTLLGHTSVNRFSAFGIVLHTYESGRRHVQLESFQLLHHLGGLTFMTGTMGTRQEETVFRALLRKGRPIYQPHVESDLRLLKFFLRNDTFRPMIDFFDWTGRTALHYAAGAVYPEAVRVLLDEGAAINAESKPVEAFEDVGATKGGLSAFDYALRGKLDGAPDRIKAGGSSEIRAWQDRLASLLHLLIDRGGQPGSRAPLEHHEHLWKLRDPRKLRTVFLTNAGILLLALA